MLIFKILKNDDLIIEDIKKSKIHVTKKQQNFDFKIIICINK